MGEKSLTSVTNLNVPNIPTGMKRNDLEAKVIVLIPNHSALGIELPPNWLSVKMCGLWLFCLLDINVNEVNCWYKIQSGGAKMWCDYDLHGNEEK